MVYERIPPKIRVSIGSAILLGLAKGKQDSNPTTIYLLTHHDDKCTANCGFCPQAKKSGGRADMLSRVIWPLYPTSKVISCLERDILSDSVKRICIQSLNYPKLSHDLLGLVKEIRSKVDLPISISCQPLSVQFMTMLKKAGVNRISIPLDAATEEVFNSVKGVLVGGPYDWKEQKESLKIATKIFGKGSVSTHLIVGLGETEKEIVQTIQWCVNENIFPGLFAFTPIPGTLLEDEPRPKIQSYRKIQIAHYLLIHRKTSLEEMTFYNDGCIQGFGIPEKVLKDYLKSGKPFVTSGCPNCNRPYYNEKPSGPLYNYPRQLLSYEIDEIEQEIARFCEFK